MFVNSYSEEKRLLENQIIRLQDKLDELNSTYAERFIGLEDTLSKLQSVAVQLHIMVDSLNMTQSSNYVFLNRAIDDLQLTCEQFEHGLLIANERLDILNATQIGTVSYICYRNESKNMFYAQDGLGNVFNGTDAWSVLQAAINQTRKDGGGIVFLKEGIYPVNQTLELRGGGVSLVGMNEECTILTSQSNITVVRTVQNYHAQVKNLCIDMNFTANVGLVVSDTWYNDIHVKIRNLGNWSVGVQVQVTEDSWGCFYNKAWVSIIGSRSYGSTGILLGTSSNVAPNFNYFSGHIHGLYYGMNIKEGKETIVEHMDVSGCHHGYRIGAKRCLFLGCYSENNDIYGYYIYNNASATIIGGYTGGNEFDYCGENSTQLVIFGQFNSSGARSGMILWSEDGKAYYVYVDSEGILQTEEYP